MRVLKNRSDLKMIDGLKTLGFVATMGALHEGHAELIKASQRENDETCVSLFVNPTQFNNEDDFKTYPDRISEDLSFCKSLGVQYVFSPPVDEIYGDVENIKFLETDVSAEFEGAHRPGHFQGVLTVVLKLLNLIKPDQAYFGKKDYQQYLLIKNMSEQLFLDTKIVGVETYRDEFGLALSSRNFNLTEEGLVKARSIANAFLKSSSKDEFLTNIKSLNPEIEYYGEDWGRVLMAHFVDGVRLIDNKDKNKNKNIEDVL